MNQLCAANQSLENKILEPGAITLTCHFLSVHSTKPKLRLLTEEASQESKTSLVVVSFTNYFPK